MRTYKYCTVVPKFQKKNFYYYLDFSEEAKVGDYVEVPFEDNVIVGEITEINYYENEDVPWPLEQMKRVLRVITKEEYDKFTFAKIYGADESESYELSEGDEVIIKGSGIKGFIFHKFWHNEAKEYLYKVESEDVPSEHWAIKCFSCYELEKVK